MIDIDILTLLSEQQASLIVSLTRIAIHSQLLSRITVAMTIIFCGGKPKNEIVLFQMEIVLSAFPLFLNISLWMVVNLN